MRRTIEKINFTFLCIKPDAIDNYVYNKKYIGVTMKNIQNNRAVTFFKYMFTPSSAATDTKVTLGRVRSSKSGVLAIEIGVILGFILTVLLSGIADFSATADDIRGQTLRLHILANSDSDIDQQAKLAVRDALLEQKGYLFTETDSLAQSVAVADSELAQIEELAQQVLSEHGLEQDVTAQTTRMFFETTTYEQFSMPGGYYEALRLTIGEGEGRNWWCVLFPPLCLPSASVEAPIEQMYDKHQLELINSEPDIRFATVELYEKYFGE